MRVNEERNKILSPAFIKEGKRILSIVEAFNLTRGAELLIRYNCTWLVHACAHVCARTHRLLGTTGSTGAACWDGTGSSTGKQWVDEETRTARIGKRRAKLELRAGVTAKPGFWRNSLEGRMGQLHKAVEKCKGLGSNSSREGGWGCLLSFLNSSASMFSCFQRRSVNALAKCLV